MDPIDYFISFPNESDFFAIHVRNMYKFKQKINDELQNDVTPKKSPKYPSNNKDYVKNN